LSALLRRLLLVSAAVLLVPAAAEPPAKGPAGKSGKSTPKPAARKKPETAPSAQQQRALQGEQQELKQQLSRLKQQLMAAEASRTEAADALAASEAAISKTNRRLRELGDERAVVERQIEALQQRSRAVAATQSRQQLQLAESLRQHDRLTLRDPFQAFLAGENPAELARDAEYYGYVTRATAARIGELQQRRSELEQLADESTKKRDELASIAEDESRNKQQLVAEQDRRKQALAQLSKQIAAQRQSIDKLERDEKRLAALIDQLSRVLAEQARRDAEREAARRSKEPAPKAGASQAPAPPPAAPRAAPSRPDAEPPPNSRFAQLRGQLPMPVVGEITGRFGSPRTVEGAGTAPTWKGIFIRAPAGTGVRAVAAGQVVFADWLRGFGNLMVIDHGESFLSVYGNNESLLRNVGERVAVGDVVASVGNTGGNDQTGLYFELRFQGRPFDPLKWVAAR